MNIEQASKYYGSHDIMFVLKDSANYEFNETQLTILLNYNLPEVSFSIQIPYTQIHNLLRAGGPIAARAHNVKSH